MLRGIPSYENFLVQIFYKDSDVKHFLVKAEDADELHAKLMINNEIKRYYVYPLTICYLHQTSFSKSDASY